MDRAGSSVLDRVVLDLAEHFGDLDDDPDAVFGEIAQVAYSTGDRTPDHRVEVWHESGEWGVEIIVRPIGRRPT